MNYGEARQADLCERDWFSFAGVQDRYVFSSSDSYVDDLHFLFYSGRRLAHVSEDHTWTPLEGTSSEGEYKRQTHEFSPYLSEDRRAQMSRIQSLVSLSMAYEGWESWAIPLRLTQSSLIFRAERRLLLPGGLLAS